MAHGTKTVYRGERNKGRSATFQPPEEGRSVQRLKRCDKHGDKDEDNSPKNINNLLTNYTLINHLTAFKQMTDVQLNFYCYIAIPKAIKLYVKMNLG